MGFKFEEARVGQRVRSTSTGHTGEISLVDSSKEKRSLVISWSDDSTSKLLEEWCLGSTVVFEDEEDPTGCK